MVFVISHVAVQEESLCMVGGMRLCRLYALCSSMAYLCSLLSASVGDEECHIATLLFSYYIEWIVAIMGLQTAKRGGTDQ